MCKTLFYSFCTTNHVDRTYIKSSFKFRTISDRMSIYLYDLLTSLARSVWKKYQNSVRTVKKLVWYFSIQTSRSVSNLLVYNNTICMKILLSFCCCLISPTTISQSTISQSTISQSIISQSTVSFRFAKYHKPIKKAKEYV